jgi:hypothetical protein
MRKRETHFEQVPIEVVETVLLKAVALERIPEKSPAPVSTPKRPSISVAPGQQKNAPSKGKL